MTVRLFAAMADLLDTHVYALIGDDGFRRLVAAFYRRVPRRTTSSVRCIRSTTWPAPRTACAGSSSSASAGRTTTPSSAATRASGMRHAAVQDRSRRPRPVGGADGSRAGRSGASAEVMPPLRQFFHDAATFMINHGGAPLGPLPLIACCTYGLFSSSSAQRARAGRGRAAVSCRRGSCITLRIDASRSAWLGVGQVGPADRADDDQVAADQHALVRRSGTSRAPARGRACG